METEQPQKLKDCCICIFTVDCWSCGATERVLVPISSFDVEAPLSTRTCGSAESPEVKSLNMLDMFSFCWKEAWDSETTFFLPEYIWKVKMTMSYLLIILLERQINWGAFWTRWTQHVIVQLLDVTVRNTKFGITAFQNFLVQKFVFVNTWILFHW